MPDAGTDGYGRPCQSNIRFVGLPWKRCLQMMREGKAQDVISLLKTPEGERYILYPQEHISVSKTQFFKKADRRIDYGGNLKNLDGFQIGVIAGFSYGPEFDEVSRDAEMLVRKFVGGRTDLAAENTTVVGAITRRFGMEQQIQFLNPPIHMQRLYVGFARNTGRKLIERFSEALKYFRMTKAYWKILGKYGICY